MLIDWLEKMVGGRLVGGDGICLRFCELGNPFP